MKCHLIRGKGLLLAQEISTTTLFGDMGAFGVISIVFYSMAVHEIFCLCSSFELICWILTACTLIQGRRDECIPSGELMMSFSDVAGPITFHLIFLTLLLPIHVTKLPCCNQTT